MLETRLAPATLTVNNLTDVPAKLTDASVTLRDALYAASNDVAVSPGRPAGGSTDTIVFAPSLFTADGQIALSVVGDGTFGPSPIAISTPIKIQAPGGTNGLTLDASAVAMRLFSIAGIGNLTLKNLSLQGGLSKGGDGGDASGFGGQATCSNNRPDAGGGAGLGGASFYQGTLTREGVTPKSNQAVGGKGARGGGAARKPLQVRPYPGFLLLTGS